MTQEFEPKMGEPTRDEIRNPEGLSSVKLPLAKEKYETKDGQLLIRPEGFSDDVDPIIGARTAERDQIAWSRENFFESAKIDPKRVVRIQQKHTVNVREITADMAGSGALDQPNDDTRVKSEDGSGLDAAWTKEKDLTLMVGTADCAAIVVSGKDQDDRDVVGIVHAGIAGAQGDIVGNLIRDMITKGGVIPKSINVYSSPNICERCYPVLSDNPSDERDEKMPKVKATKIKEDGQEVTLELTKLSASVLEFKKKYNNAFRTIHGRDLAENDFYYVDRDDKDQLELHLNLNMFVYLPLIGNGVDPQNIGFSNICSAHDNLPSSRRAKETTGIFSTIRIK